MSIDKREGRFASSAGEGMVAWTGWREADAPVRAVLLIAHGMAEHIDRYDAFARHMAGHGYAVYGNDHLGHGRSAKEGEHGYMGPQGHMHMVEDIGRLREVAVADHPGVPVIVMGHSMGSFIARAYCARHPEIPAAAIFMGTAGPNPMAGIGLALNRVLSAVKGPRAHSKLFDSMTTGNFNKAIKGETRTEVDWLSTDEAEVDKYIADPWCGFPFTLAGYRDLLRLIREVSEDGWAAKLRRDMPVLLIAGAEDPVGGNGEGVRIVYERLRAAGQRDVELVLYEGMRHEILNERERARVYADLLNWCDRMIECEGD